MPSNQWHREQAELWAATAKLNLDQFATDASSFHGASPALAMGAHAQAALAQAHATLALGKEG